MAFCYETEIGLIFKDKLKISTDAITWKGHTTPLDTISGVRWGRITYVYGNVSRIPIKIDYKISFQSPFYEAKINPKKQKQYEEITGHLWRLLAAPISVRILTQLQNGGELSIGGIKFNDNGVFLKRLGLFSREFFTWLDPLTISSNNGFCTISAKNARYSASASFMNDMNTIVFDAIMHKFFRNLNINNPTLSSLLF